LHNVKLWILSGEQLTSDAATGYVIDSVKAAAPVLPQTFDAALQVVIHRQSRQRITHYAKRSVEFGLNPEEHFRFD
jgi:hypothetical protein